MFIIEQIDQACAAHGITPLKLMDEAGIAKSNYCHWKDRKHTPCPLSIRKVEDAINRLEDTKKVKSTIIMNKNSTIVQTVLDSNLSAEDKVTVLRSIMR